MIDEKKINSTIGVMQNIILENREKLNVTGINDILSFDDQIIILSTELGMLTIKGENLKINKLNIDESEVKIEGNINNISYSQSAEYKKNDSLFSKIFR